MANCSELNGDTHTPFPRTSHPSCVANPLGVGSWVATVAMLPLSKAPAAHVPPGAAACALRHSGAWGHKSVATSAAYAFPPAASHITRHPRGPMASGRMQHVPSRVPARPRRLGRLRRRRIKAAGRSVVKAAHRRRIPTAAAGAAKHLPDPEGLAEGERARSRLSQLGTDVVEGLLRLRVGLGKAAVL